MNDELITLEVDDAKVRQIIAKIRKSIKSFSITSGKSFILPPRDELLSSKYHLSFLELRNEGLAIEKLIKDAEKTENSTENSNLIPKYINSHYLDGRFSIFTTHSTIRTDISHIQYDLSLKFGQIVAFHSDSNEILLGMVATKLNEDVYRVFDLSDDFMFTICTSNQLCPFPIVLPKVLNANSSFSAGDKVIAFSSSSLQDRKHFTIQSGEVVCLFTNAETNEENYNVKLSDGSVISTEPYHLAKFDSPFTCTNEQAEELKQEHLANGIDPTVMLDPKEARKFKNANAKKLRDMKKKAAESADNQQVNQKNGAESSSDKKKEKKKQAITMATRHSLRSRSITTSDNSKKSDENSSASVSTSPSKQTISKEISREAVGIPVKLPLTPDLPNVTSSPSNAHQIPMAAPPRVIQLQNMQMHHQLQQQYLFQQQMMLHHQPYPQSQTNKNQVSQSLTVSPTQYTQHQQLPVYQQKMNQVQQSAFQVHSPSLGATMKGSSPDHQKSSESANESQVVQQDEIRHVPPAKDESRAASCYKPQNDSNDSNSIQMPTSILAQPPRNQIENREISMMNNSRQESKQAELSISNNGNEVNEICKNNFISIVSSRPVETIEPKIEQREPEIESAKQNETPDKSMEQRDSSNEIEESNEHRDSSNEIAESNVQRDSSNEIAESNIQRDSLNETVEPVEQRNFSNETIEPIEQKDSSNEQRDYSNEPAESNEQRDFSSEIVEPFEQKDPSNESIESNEQRNSSNEPIESNEQRNSSNEPIESNEQRDSSNETIEPNEQRDSSIIPTESIEQRDIFIEPTELVEQSEQRESSIKTDDSYEPEYSGHSLGLDGLDSRTRSDELSELINQVRADELNKSANIYDPKISIESQRNLHLSNFEHFYEPTPFLELEKTTKLAKSLESYAAKQQPSELLKPPESEELAESNEPLKDKESIESAEPIELPKPKEASDSEENTK